MNWSKIWNILKQTPGLYINSFPIAMDKEKKRIVQEYMFATYKSAIKTDGKLKSSILNGRVHWLQEKKYLKQFDKADKKKPA